MSTIETYKQEIETELNLTRDKLVELKAKIRGLSDLKRLKSIEEVEGLDKIASNMRIKITELGKEMENSWKQIKDDIYSSRNTIDEAFARLNRALVI